MAAILNLTPTQDQYITVKACRQPCDARCGDCALCDRACPENCRQGVKDGNGHVWSLFDRLPAHQMRDLIASRQDVLQASGIAFQKAQTGEPMSAEDQQSMVEGTVLLRELVLAVFRRDYPGIDEDNLDERLGIEGYLQVAARFLSRLAASSGPPPTQEQVERTMSAIPKPRSSRKNSRR